jgi:hypothetical protein
MASKQDSSERESPQMTGTPTLGAPYDFSLVVGGPLFLLLRKIHLSGDALELVRRRVIVVCMIAWMPLFLLVLATARKADLVSFRQDVEMHVRLLIALPLLLAGELIVHAQIRFAVPRFIERRLILPDGRPSFHKAIESAVRLRNSAVAQIAFLILVYTVGLWHWQNRVPIIAPTWYAMSEGRSHLTPAGYWYVLVSIPIVQFLLLCWYWRFFVWCRFLWQVSRIKLHLISTHPDRCAGLGFLGSCAYGFATILFAQGAMLAGVVATRVLYRGEQLMSFRLQMIGFVAFFVFAVLGPLLVFTPQIAAARRKGLGIYGQLAQDYVESFEHKWVMPGSDSVEGFLGSPDIQSLADISNSYSIVRSMRLVPFGLIDITRLAAATAAPFAPLLLTIFSLEELVMRIINALF